MNIFGDKTYELYLEVTDWQHNTFEDTGLSKQIAKLAEEMAEYEEAEDQDHALQEIADVYISACGLGETLYNAVLSEIICMLDDWGIAFRRMEEVLIEAVQAKMKINRSRTWVKGENGVYRHTEPSCDEKLHNPIEAIEKRSIEPIMDELKPMYDKFTGRTGNYE